MLSDGTYSKLCDADDFPALTGHFAAMGDTLTYHRKQWEYAMVLRNMEALSALNDKADVLGLACETEPVIYYAAARARSVLATDLTRARAAAIGRRTRRASTTSTDRRSSCIRASV